MSPPIAVYSGAASAQFYNNESQQNMYQAGRTSAEVLPLGSTVYGSVPVPWHACGGLMEKARQM